MSRVIKFRAWDVLAENMFGINDSPQEFWSKVHPASCDVYIMQFTGLHDKDGKEIYEGDILASGECIIGSVSYCTDPFCFYAAQFYITDGFGFAADESTLEDCDKHLSVVGNIHETPELLETQND